MKVRGYDLDGNPIGSWDSTRAAGRELNISHQNISAAAKGKRNTAGGYTWAYIEYVDEVEREIAENSRLVTETDTIPNDYNKGPSGFNAIHPETLKVMDLNTYCDYYGLPREDVTSYKFISHTAVPYYNIVFKEKISDGMSDFDVDQIKTILTKKIKYKARTRAARFSTRGETVLKLADLHFGAYIRDLVISQDYDSSILERALMDIADDVNTLGFSKVHIHIQGDLIESFSGLNHINSWMSMNPREIGSNAVMLCAELIHKFLDRLENVGKVKIVGGNHDRTSKANDEDVKGQAAELIAWGLGLMGYDVEFHSYIIVHQVGGINHICLHGDKGVSKRSTEDILWKYGKQGVYNFITEAHLHTLIEKLSAPARAKFKVMKDDAIDHRRMHLASLFTGNYYSETLGFTTNPGYLLIWERIPGKPQMYYGSTNQ